MDAFVFMALAATLGTWLLTALGAATVVFFRSPEPRGLNLMLGFASGVMIAASFWSLLQPAIERAQAMPGLPAWLVATAGFLFGAAFMWGSDKTVSFARRLQVAKMLLTGATYSMIQEQLPVSSATITRINTVLQYGEGGYRRIVERLMERDAKPDGV
jgi:ZIP family zinc transporter